MNTGTDNFDNHPMNYKVPNFGVDQDIIDTQRHLKDALKLAGKKSWNGYGWDKLNVQLEREPLLSYGKVETAQPHPGIKYPINYPVPDFGVDTDILDSQQNLHNVEINLGHDLNLKAGGSLNTGTDNFDNHPMNYKVPNFGVDQDIIDTQRHLKDALKLAGKKSWNGYGWDKLNVQLEREPLLSYGTVLTAAPKKGIDHPINYPVPSFGVDSDILES